MTGPPWAQVPATPAARLRPVPAAAAIAAVVSLLGPVARAWSLSDSRPGVVALVGATAVSLACLVPSGLWFLRIAAAAVAAAVIAPGGGEIIAVWLAAGVALAPWVAFGRPPLPALPSDVRSAATPVVALCSVAAWIGTDDAASWQPLIPLALACALPLMLRLHHGALDRAGARIGEVVGDAVAAVTFTALGLVVVALPWLWQRALAVDPLGPPSTGWISRHRAPLQAARPWAPSATDEQRPANRRKRSLLALAVAVGLVVWVAPGIGRGGRGDGGDRTATALGAPAVGSGGAGPEGGSGAKTRPAAHRADGWYGGYVEDINWVLDEKVALRPLEVYRLKDVETRTVNVHDRYRDTTAPPPCGCTPLTVWLYGGGAAFGFDQRDDHTIASELVALAADEGLSVEVSNRGMLGQGHWRNSLRFAIDLTTDTPPDIVVFYEGAEEIASAESLDRRGVGDIAAPYEAFVEDLYDDLDEVWGETPDADRTAPAAPQGVEYLGWPKADGTWARGGRSGPSTGAQIGRLAVTRYERSLLLSDDTATAAGLPVRYFWQPSRFSRPRAEAASAGSPAEDRVRASEFAAASTALEGTGVVDLTDVFAGVRSPLFVDDVHHNERGARLVAAAMLDELRPQLKRLQGEQGQDEQGDGS